MWSNCPRRWSRWRVVGGIFVMHFRCFLLGGFKPLRSHYRNHQNPEGFMVVYEGRPLLPIQSTKPGSNPINSSRISHWHCRWCRRKSQCTTATTLRWNDPHFDLCRGSYGFEWKVFDFVWNELWNWGNSLRMFFFWRFQMWCAKVLDTLTQDSKRILIDVEYICKCFPRHTWNFELGHRIVYLERLPPFEMAGGRLLLVWRHLWVAFTVSPEFWTIFNVRTLFYQTSWRSSTSIGGHFNDLFFRYWRVYLSNNKLNTVFTMSCTR